MEAQEPLPEIKGRNPLFYIIALVLGFLLIVSIVPYYAVRTDPYPRAMPTIDDIAPGLGITNITGTFNSSDQLDFNKYLTPDDPFVKEAATRIATFGCDSDKLCQAKAEYYFVRNNFAYVSEHDEYIESPKEIFATRGGDCDDHAVLLANLLQAIGIPTRFVFVPGHVFNEAYIRDAPRKYTKDGWIYLDSTCKDCEFGKLARQYDKDEMSYQ